MNFKLEKWVGQLVLAISFFSRIPLPQRVWKTIPPNANLANAVIAFPVIGLIIAAFPAFVWFSASQALPTLAASGLAIACGLIITGALHEDGLADCADGFGATGDREKTLEIMRDSRIGTYGAIALIMSIGLRWVALASLDPVTGVYALFVCHPVSRATISLAMQFANYARPSGLGKTVEEGMPEYGFAITTLIAFALAIAIGGIPGVIAFIGAYVMAWLVLAVLKYRLDGYTGDGLGAMQQVSEITVLLIFAGAYGLTT